MMKEKAVITKEKGRKGAAADMENSHTRRGASQATKHRANEESSVLTEIYQLKYALLPDKAPLRY